VSPSAAPASSSLTPTSRAASFRYIADDAVSTLRRLVDNQLQLHQRIAVCNADVDRLRAAVDAVRLYIAAKCIVNRIPNWIVFL
jgi:hypothetical protein